LSHWPAPPLASCAGDKPDSVCMCARAHQHEPVFWPARQSATNPAVRKVHLRAVEPSGSRRHMHPRVAQVTAPDGSLRSLWTRATPCATGSWTCEHENTQHVNTGSELSCRPSSARSRDYRNAQLAVAELHVGERGAVGRYDGGRAEEVPFDDSSRKCRSSR
jgi:hypothetical protein